MAVERILIIGLGSMGKRRVRCLQALGVKSIIGFDTRADRRQESVDRYGIEVVHEVTPAVIESADAVVISVWPDLHATYMRMATDAKRGYFVEASVIDEDLAGFGRRAEELGIVAAPSATMCFHPGIRKITEMVRSEELGRVSHFMYHMGQYLPDWHTYEPVSAFYVSNPITGGAREIVPFELTWVVRCFGWPKGVLALVRKTTTIEGAEGIDDTYSMLLEFGHPATMTIDVVSRFASRNLTIAASDAHLQWDWNMQEIRVYNPVSKTWHLVPYDAGVAAEGYNKNIGEGMYADEMRAFLDAVEGSRPFPNTMVEDARVLNILTSAEASSRSGSMVWLTA